MFLIVLRICLFISFVSSKNCKKDFDIKLNTVIISRDSENSGATILHELSASSLEECVKYCCESAECSVGVFGPKKGGTCLLFNCDEPNVCKFETEPNHTVFLQRSSKQHSSKLRKMESFPQRTLFDTCGHFDPCVRENTVCESGQCVCKAGFVEKHRKCVPSLCNKPDLQFQCDDSTTCIAIYDVCNGISECSDGSDESFCNKATLPKPSILKASRSEAVSTSSSANNFIVDGRLLFRHNGGQDIPELNFSSLKPFPIKASPMIRNLPYGREHMSSNYPSSIENGIPGLMATEPRRKSIYSERSSGTSLESSNQLHTLSDVLVDNKYSDEELELEHRRRKTGSRLLDHSRHNSPQEMVAENDSEFPHFRSSNSGKSRRFLRRSTRPRSTYSSSKSRGRQLLREHHTDSRSISAVSEVPLAPSMSSFIHNGYQWHTAAILLAIGLGLISCLFGILVGRCRQRGRFDRECPRSRAVAQSHLRRRILRTRDFSNNDIERSGLLSKLEL